jgi:hypothetical protein
MLTAMNMKIKELNDGLLLRGRADIGRTAIVVEVVETGRDQYYLVTGSKAGICWNFDDPNNFDCWDFEPVKGDTIGELINQIEGLLKFYRAEDGC